MSLVMRRSRLRRRVSDAIGNAQTDIGQMATVVDDDPTRILPALQAAGTTTLPVAPALAAQPEWPEPKVIVVNRTFPAWWWVAWLLVCTLLGFGVANAVIALR